MKASARSARHSQDRWKGRRPSSRLARRFAGLQHVDEQPGRGAHSGGGGPGNGRRPEELSTLQKLGVGFAGEWLAYQWLAQQYGPDFTQDCWVSNYREQVLPGTGDDGLGWDFEVPVRRGKHLYEVKSTLGDGGQVELGETQVRAAQENARNANWRLLVVTNVLNENRRIRMLKEPVPSSLARAIRIRRPGPAAALCHPVSQRTDLDHRPQTR